MHKVSIGIVLFSTINDKQAAFNIPILCTVYPKQIKKGQLFIELIMQPYEDIPNSDNMRVLNNVISFEGTSTRNVIIRGHITEEFWQSVIDATEDYRVCALGSPGIGKTTSTCILIRLLLQQKHTVLYHVRRLKNNGFVYMFIPALEPSSNCDVKVFRENQFDYIDDEFNNTYYVVDPGKTNDNCDLDADFEGKVIIVSSPNQGHWGNSEFEKERDGVSGTFRFYPVWEVHELLAARKFLGQ